MKFIYFDVGGVITVDFSANNKRQLIFDNLGINQDRMVELNRCFDEFENESVTGRSIEDFVFILKNNFEAKIPENYNLQDDFVSKFENNDGIWNIVKMCQEKFRIGLLTNMYPNMLNQQKENNLIPNVNWEIVVDSSIVKMKKPDENIYLLAQERTGVEANEILFIDNVDKNLDVPKKLGWKTFLYDSSDYERSNNELESFLR